MQSSLFSVRPAQAYTVTLEQVGANVVANGSGAINLTGLTFFSGDCHSADPNAVSEQYYGARALGRGHVYTGFTGPTSFGSGVFFFANTGSGDLVGIIEQVLATSSVPQGYVSGTALSDSMTFNNATFASLGVTPGTYIWSWGTGLPNQNFTLIIGGVAFPMAAQQFLCSVSLYSAWLPCGANCVVKVLGGFVNASR